MIEPNKLSPFQKFCITIGMLPSSYKTSLTYEEQILWLCDYLENTVIPTINTNAEAVKEIQNLLIELKNYVDNYFKNLDIQQEINNKLDKMAQDGTLQELITAYLNINGILAFNTVNDMIIASNLIDGSFVKTFGKLNYNDGEGAFYKIRNITNQDIIDNINIIAIINNENLVAELIKDKNIIDILNDIKNINNNIENINNNIENINNNIENINNQINYNKLNNLTDNVQCKLIKELNNLFDYESGWSLSSVCFDIVNNEKVGIAVANNWEANGTGGTTFNIVTFKYINNIISDVNLRYENVAGHSNSSCNLGNNKILIIALQHNYIYDLINNTYIEVTEKLPYSVGCTSYKDKIYTFCSFNYNTNILENKLYELNFINDTNDFELLNTYLLEDLWEKLNYLDQGFTIYNDLIIFPSTTPVKLCIYDFNSKKYIKTQLICNPYIVEYEDGIILDNKLYLCDSLGRLFEPDIYNKSTIGGYSSFVLTKSLTDIALIDKPIKLNIGESTVIDFKKFMTFLNNNDNSNIGTLGSQLEYITIFLAVRTSEFSEGLHSLTPVNIPLYKLIEYNGQSTGWLDIAFNSEFSEIDASLNCYLVKIFGKIAIGGGDTVPNIGINIATKLYNKTIVNNTEVNERLITFESLKYEVYVTKIIGHRKIYEGY